MFLRQLAFAASLTLSVTAPAHAQAQFTTPSRLTVIRAAGLTALLGGGAVMVTSVIALGTVEHPDVRLLGLHKRLLAVQAAIADAETLTALPDQKGLVEMLKQERRGLVELLLKHGVAENQAPSPAQVAEMRKQFVAQAQRTNSSLIRRVVGAGGGIVLMLGGLGVVLASESLDQKLAASNPERALAEAGIDRDELVGRALAAHVFQKDLLE